MGVENAQEKRFSKQLIKTFVVLLAFMSMLSMTVALPALPKFVAYFSLDKDTAQQIFSLIFFGSAVAGILYGPLSDAYGRRPVLLSSMIFSAVVALSSVFCQKIEVFMTLQVLLGLNIGAGSVISLVIVKDYFKGVEATKFMATIGLISPLAPSMGPFVGGCLESYWGWQGIYYFIFLIQGALCVAFYFLLPETHGRQNRIAYSFKNLVRNFMIVLKNSSFWKYGIVLFLYFGGLQVYNVSAAFVFMNQMQIPVQDFTFYIFMSTIGVILGNFLVRTLVEKLGQARLLMYSSFIAALAAAGFFGATMMAVPTPFVYVTFMFVYCMGLGMGFSTGLPLGMETVPNARGYTTALLRLFQMVGAAVSTSIAAEFYDQTFLATAIMLLTFSVALLMLTKHSYLK